MAAGSTPTIRAAQVWREAFTRMPYSRELTVPLGVINDTFETAVTWDKFEDFHTAVAAATAEAIKEATGSAGTVSTRFTHVYPETRHLRSRPAAVLQKSEGWNWTAYGANATAPIERCWSISDPTITTVCRNAEVSFAVSCAKKRAHRSIPRMQSFDEEDRPVTAPP